MNEEATRLALRLLRAAGLPDDFSGSFTIHVDQGQPHKGERRDFSRFPRLTATSADVDRTANKDVA